MTVGGGQLERELGSLLDVDRFEPPEEFRARAAVSDATVHREADADFAGWWERQAAQLDWFEPWSGARLDEPAVREVVRRWQAERLAQLLDRHVEAQDPLGQDHAPPAARHRRGRELGDVTTLRDPEVIEQFQQRVRARAGEED